MNESQTFSSLCSKIRHLFLHKTQKDHQTLERILDEFNSLSYRYIFVSNNAEAVLLINQCCTIISPDDTVLVRKYSQIIVNLINNQKIRIEGDTLDMALNWCLTALKKLDYKQLLEILMALEAILRNNIPKSAFLIQQIVEHVTSLVNSNSDQTDIFFAAVCNLEACSLLIKDSKSCNNDKLLRSFEICAEIFVKILCVKDDSNVSRTVINCKITEMCLLGLQNLIHFEDSYFHEHLGLILGIIKSYMLYNMEKIKFLSPDKLMPSTVGLPEAVSKVPREKTGGKMMKQRRPKPNKKKKNTSNSDEGPVTWNNNNEYVPAKSSLSEQINSTSNLHMLVKTSDSDFTDSELGNVNAKIIHFSKKVRQEALNLFYHVIKHTEKSTMFSYWLNFIPESSTSDRHNLLTCILEDRSVRSQMCALNVLLWLLTSSKLYLLQSELSEKASSFTPYCSVLGLSLMEIHKCLLIALNNQSNLLTTQVLKCLAALVQATPYHKINTGLITDIVWNVHRFIYHRDVIVQVMALIVMGCIIAYEPIVPEIKQAMLMPKIENHYENRLADLSLADENARRVEKNMNETKSISWLLEKCVKSLGNNNSNNISPIPVKLECLQIISAMSRNYFETFMLPHLPLITKSLEYSILIDDIPDLKLHCGRAIEFVGQAIGTFAEKQYCTGTCYKFWDILLNKALIELIQQEKEPLLRAVACDCLGSIGPIVFEEFSKDKQLLFVSLLFGCARDSESHVKGAAVRALALSVSYPSLQEDFGFIMDTTQSILDVLEDQNPMVKAKASWSLATLSEVVALNSKFSDTDEKLPRKMLLTLFEAAIKWTNDSEKLKMNMVRALGNLLCLMDAEALEEQRFQSMSERALKTLAHAAGTGSNGKGRWNACHAIATALKNPCLYKQLDRDQWQPLTFNTLMDLVIGFKNFKVRINAALALSMPTVREYYGEFYLQIWIALLKALENSQNLDDFTEYMHRDHLIEQICLTLCHLATLLTATDLPFLTNIINSYSDIFSAHMHRVLDRVVPEKLTELALVQQVLQNLEKLENIGATERNTAHDLKCIFIAKS